MKIFKERAQYSPDWAKRADAAETRWERFVDDGPPPAPVVDQQIRVRLRGGDSARRVVALHDARRSTGSSSRSTTRSTSASASA